MCSEYCFECQEPCWEVNIFFGNDPGYLVSRADINENTITIPTSLTVKDIRQYNEKMRNEPAVKPPNSAGYACYASLAEKEQSLEMFNVQPARSMWQDQHKKKARCEADMATLPGEMPGHDHKKPWYAVGD